MGVKQDAWDAEVTAFDAATPAYTTARTTLLSEWASFKTFLDTFVVGGDCTQAQWDTWILTLRRATMTKGARFESGVEVRPAETQRSLLAVLDALDLRLDNLKQQARILIADVTVPIGVRRDLNDLDFTAERVAYTPTQVSYKVGDETRTAKAPHWWLYPNQFSDLIVRGRGEPKLDDDPANVRLLMTSARIVPTIDHTVLFALRDDCAAITGID